jgi:diaminopimelate decarboxylase
MMMPHPTMPALQHDGEQWIFDGVPLVAIAQMHGTPCYVYSHATICENYRRLDTAFGSARHLICYAVKANSNLAVLGALAQLGAGFDIVSGGELARVLAAGGDPGKVIFSGVGKTAPEIAHALAAGIKCFNIESEPELERINDIAGQLGRRAPVSVRVNPDIDAGTHPYISTGLSGNKFGVPFARVIPTYERAASLPHIDVVGIDCHIGSQILDTAPLTEAMGRLVDLCDTLEAKGIPIHHIDNGGGVGIPYQSDDVTRGPDSTAYIATLKAALGQRDKLLMIEPGRALVGNAGLLLTRVEYLKTDKAKAFCVVDASMSELLRPMLYEAWHDIIEVCADARPAGLYDVVGPVCETTDKLASDRTLRVAAGDLLAVLSAGAYGFVMASNYNTRPLPPEVMVARGQAHLVRHRQTLSTLFETECLLP